MQIYFQRTGGFVGMKMTANLDSLDFSMDEQQELVQLIRQADFFRLPTRIMSKMSQPDRFQYLLTIRDETLGDKTVEVGEEALSPELKPLVDFLMARLRKQRSAKR